MIPSFLNPNFTTVLVTTYNTISIPSGNTATVVTSESPPAGPFYYNVLNLGPAVVYLTDNSNPQPAASNVETLPNNMADNGIFIAEGTKGLNILAGNVDSNGSPQSTASVTIRVVQSTMATSW